MTSETVAAYESSAEAYRERHQKLPDHVRGQLDELVVQLGAGGRVLEIGSGGGRDADYLELRGLRVRRTDVVAAFVASLRRDGHPADLLDPLSDDLSDPAGPDERYDAVWANASLLHVRRADLPTVLARLRAVARPAGLLRALVKEGEGQGWSTHGPVAARRFFVYWSEPELRNVVEGAGWSTVQIERVGGPGGEQWLVVRATG